ncbi:MAG: hypothetical protein KKG47_08790 [Proteobacteria bacterium]|nr:hypothetical protein [Pseudomonadota bacterium]MBU1736739.1 hypothetical protein [Pseudomonadota bacterium]
MKNKVMITLATALMIFGLVSITHAATFDVTVDGAVLTGTEGIKNDQGHLITVPTGAIIMWSNTQGPIPVGWGLCDGSTYGTITTPNLVDKFILGGKDGTTRPVDSEGGSHYLPDHIHTGATNTNGSHFHTSGEMGVPNGVGQVEGDPRWKLAAAGTTGDGPHSHNVTVGYGSAPASTSIIPKYYALAYIMKL